jgi:perosamine synthetase
MNKISWFKTCVGEPELSKIREAFRHECVSMGRVTEELEAKLAASLGVPYCVVTTSGSVALLLALLALSVRPGDEVIVPNRGWVAAAHAVLLVGAKVVLADVQPELPLMDIEDVKRKITSRTKAIIPLHLNGRSVVGMKALLKLAREKGISVIEDACQAIFSKNTDGFLGTQGTIGCFSLGMAKLVATGQGGFLVMKDEAVYRDVRSLRSHGVRDNFTEAWYKFGFNFKFTDIQAAVGLAQLERVGGRIQHLQSIYRKYDEALAGMRRVKMVPVKVAEGEIPLYIEALALHRDDLIEFLKQRNIQARPATPDLDPSAYLGQKGDFPYSRKFADQGIYLPGGPEQPLENIDSVIEALREFEIG